MERRGLLDAQLRQCRAITKRLAAEDEPLCVRRHALLRSTFAFTSAAVKVGSTSMSKVLRSLMFLIEIFIARQQGCARDHSAVHGWR